MAHAFSHPGRLFTAIKFDLSLIMTNRGIYLTGFKETCKVTTGCCAGEIDSLLFIRLGS